MQTRKHSLREALNSTAIGFVLSAVAQQLVITPYFGLPTSAAQNLQITLFFTVLSVARSYCTRRFHIWLDNKKNKHAINPGTAGG